MYNKPHMQNTSNDCSKCIHVNTCLMPQVTNCIGFTAGEVVKKVKTGFSELDNIKFIEGQEDDE